MSFISQLIKNIESELTLPEVDAGRCVHTHLQFASCQACVEHCPTNAWIFNDEELAIDPNLCDGCGVCVAYCSEQALSLNHSITIRRDLRGLMAVICCERASSNEIESMLPCLHSISRTEILKYWQNGIHRWFIASGNCKQCSRQQVDGFQHRVDEINQILRENQQTQIEISLFTWNQLKEVMDETSSDYAHAKMSRRVFLRQAIQSTGKRVIESNDEVDTGANFISDNHLLPRNKKLSRLFSVPIIDIHGCNGCDACVRLCPHKALTYQQQSSYYEIRAINCTGCGLCEDVCEQDAIHVTAMIKPEQYQVRLSNYQCSSCGIHFHQPGKGQDVTLCRICQKSPHQHNLYQVLEG